MNVMKKYAASTGLAATVNGLCVHSTRATDSLWAARSECLKKLLYGRPILPIGGDSFLEIHYVHRAIKTFITNSMRKSRIRGEFLK